jgi:hypothetical protein
MKISNKLITAAFLLIFVSLFIYDHLLKAEYISGRYKDPYRDFVTLNNKDFEAVDVISTNAVNVKFIQGPFSVKVNVYAREFASISQQGHRLKIYSHFPHDYVQNGSAYLVIISCPKLAEVNANAIFGAGDKQIIDTVIREDWHMRQNLIEGFKEDSLSIIQNYGSGIILSNNQIRALNVIIGKGKKSRSKITILTNNHIQQADMDILNRSQFLLEGTSIHDLKYQLADSAQIIFKGTAQNIINKSKSYQK